ncbi:MAG: triosephosphate isomerase, partial [Planctomycetes bacterium]|nr:triosephosphate isomerase [Planctomycetota bacterium]
MATRPWITARDLRATPDLEIPADANLTPLARDLVRARGVEPRRFDAAGARREALIVANWKSHKTRAEAREFVASLAANRDLVRAAGSQLVVCPPFTALQALGEAVAEAGVSLELGAQDVSPHEEGAHTGEVAARHLVEIGCQWVIVGHSERRYAGEGDALVARKLRVALAAELQPILCV